MTNRQKDPKRNIGLCSFRIIFHFTTSHINAVVVIIFYFLEISKTPEDAAPHEGQVNDDVFFVYQPPQLSKLDIFIKISVVLFLLCGVVASAVLRIYL